MSERASGGKRSAASQAGVTASGGSNAGTKTKTEPDAPLPLQEVPGATLAELKIAEIVPNRVNPRTVFEPQALAELTHSIREFGVFQPIVVRPLAAVDAPHDGAKYEIIMGERRFRASQQAGKTTIPAIIQNTTDENMLRDALLENLHRANLNPLEEASAYQQLMSDFGITQEQLAERIGRSRPQISNTIRLLRLPEQVQEQIVAGELSAGHARAILALKADPAETVAIAKKVVKQRLSVREVEQLAVAEQEKKVAPPRAGGLRSQLEAVESRLAERFGTRVQVKLGPKKGQVVIDFATIADLKNILAELGETGV
ncbi:MAG: ParB/RepB/Spo0J family partition protein [Microbacteriaceae bacterium]|nr:ParB/RepB/Spo0J family partition protein [Microbacteriaceae bacterium]